MTHLCFDLCPNVSIFIWDHNLVRDKTEYKDTQPFCPCRYNFGNCAHPDDVGAGVSQQPSLRGGLVRWSADPCIRALEQRFTLKLERMSSRKGSTEKGSGICRRERKKPRMR